MAVRKAGAAAVDLGQELGRRREVRVSEARATWRRLAALVAAGGECSLADVEALDDAADTLEVPDVAELFAADVERVRQADRLGRAQAGFSRERHAAAVEAARDRLEAAEAELRAARGALAELRHAGEAATGIAIELGRLHASCPRLFAREGGAA